MRKVVVLRELDVARCPRQNSVAVEHCALIVQRTVHPRVASKILVKPAGVSRGRCWSGCRRFQHRAANGGEFSSEYNRPLNGEPPGIMMSSSWRATQRCRRPQTQHVAAATLIVLQSNDGELDPSLSEGTSIPGCQAHGYDGDLFARGSMSDIKCPSDSAGETPL